MSTWLICGGGTRARCNSCRNAPLTRGVLHRLPGSTTCYRILSTPPSAQGESDSPQACPDEKLEINIFGQKVTRTGSPCSFCGFKGHKVETCYRKHPHMRPPSGARKKGLKEGLPCKGCGSTWHSPDGCWNAIHT